MAAREKPSSTAPLLKLVAEPEADVAVLLPVLDPADDDDEPETVEPKPDVVEPPDTESLIDIKKLVHTPMMV